MRLLQSHIPYNFSEHYQITSDSYDAVIDKVEKS